MQAEGVKQHLQLVDSEHHRSGSLAALSTLLCFVLVHAESGAHDFCSRYDFGPWPLLQGFSTTQLNRKVLNAFGQTRTVMINGFVFDELAPEVVQCLATRSRQSGAAVFFDPGATRPNPWL